MSTATHDVITIDSESDNDSDVVVLSQPHSFLAPSDIGVVRSSSPTMNESQATLPPSSQPCSEWNLSDDDICSPTQFSVPCLKRPRISNVDERYMTDDDAYTEENFPPSHDIGLSDTIHRSRLQEIPVNIHVRTSSPEKEISGAKRSNKTPEEKLREKEEKEAIKAQKKEEKDKQRAEAARAKIEEKEKKQRHKAANKLVVDKKTTLSDMFVELGVGLHEEFGDDLGRKMDEFDCTVSVIKPDAAKELREIRNLMLWKRRITAIYNNETKEYEPLSEEDIRIRSEATYMLYFAAHTAGALGNQLVDHVKSLRSVATAIYKTKTPKVMVMIDGWTGFKGGRGQRKILDRIFVRLQMDRCTVVHVDGPQDAITWMYNLTADLGMKQHKLRQRSHLAFCSDINVKTGTSDRDTYMKMLQQMPRVTKAAAEGIVELYPTMQQLFEAYRSCTSQAARDNLLVNAQVRTRTDGMLSKEGRVLNNALSSRVAAVMWGEDPLAIVT